MKMTQMTILNMNSNRKGNPKCVTTKKLKSGDYIWRRQGKIYVSKWKDKRDVLAITTKYQPQLLSSKNRFGNEKKNRMKLFSIIIT